MIKVLFFASLREATQTRELERPLTSPITVRELAEQLQQEFPNLSLSGSLCAINEDYANPDDSIRTGDTVAFLPPVSGG